MTELSERRQPVCVCVGWRGEGGGRADHANDSGAAQLHGGQESAALD